MKKTIAIIAAIALILTAAIASAKTYTIGIGQFAQHGSLDNCYEGFILGLAEGGYVEGENLTIDFENAMNGGPLTLEFHQSIFADDDGIEKVGLLVKNFIDRGGHQLQLNTVNLDKMLDAQKHPENYRQLVVRIWGWSAYFVELDKEYQDHVIARQAYTV